MMKWLALFSLVALLIWQGQIGWAIVVLVIAAFF